MTRGGLERDWDMVVIGGGITGAGVFRRAAALGYRVLLVEQQDFAWGTSSRSGKLVHGGLRYVAQGQLRTSFHSVRERERLLAELPGLVRLIDFALPQPWGGLPVRLGIKLMFLLWDAMAGRRNHRYLSKDALRALIPGLDTRGRPGFVYGDGSTDDARLVLRIIQQATDLGGVARNYTRVRGFERDAAGRIHAVQLEDAETGEAFVVNAKVVVNATGAWVDELRRPLGHPPIIRRLRGSHLFLAQDRLPLPSAVIFPSVRDGRTLYAVPWEGVTLVGCTDLDHHGDLVKEPYMTTWEGEYILDAAKKAFPGLDLGPADVIATQAGVRPVVGHGLANPSKEPRDSKVLTDANLISVSGGKLTTFDFMARRALRRAAAWLPAPPRAAATPPTAPQADLPERILGRFGRHAPDLLAEAADALEPIGGTAFTFAEARWSAAHEQVVHLDDLMLRRTRLGLLLPRGGEAALGRIQQEVAPLLGWSEQRWSEELSRYRALWARAYAPERLTSAPEAPAPSADPAAPLAAAG
ncbi:MAG: glycerol-3-phosphate dehydrogenase/oxidase [Deltaproteobacteria bacterium]|nr:glycerol-3-phosphate dehydrogenase/oxidase [Deltaproteobacteria bacterium]